MVGVDELREYMRSQAEIDRNQRSVQVSGDTLEDALKRAATELDVPYKQLEYEVIQQGSRGTLGLGKRPWMIMALEAVATGETGYDYSEDSSIDFGGFGDHEDIPEDRDGEVFVRLTPEGVLMKATEPVGEGSPATESDAIELLRIRGVEEFKKNVVSNVVKRADGEYIKVGEFDYNPANDAIMTVDISSDEMKAYIIASPPGRGGADLTEEGIVSVLKNNGVVFGLLEGSVRSFVDKPRYNEHVLIAEGKQPEHGENAKIIYNFETDPTQIHLKERDGKIDFKELNRIQNVVEGQVLAKKVPAQEGEPGRTVTGTMLDAKDGKDRNIGVGKNVRLSDDGLSAMAEINGQVVMIGEKINVEPVYVVPGDVNIKSGNILFLGAVIVKGNIEDGFTVKAAGNIEVMGSVGKATLDADGDIIVHQGISAKQEGTIRCGKSIWSKFIENAIVDCGEQVVVSDGIINSTITAKRRVLCQGKRASIVGGKIMAVEEIAAKNLGSVAGGETILEVGHDPKARERKNTLEKNLAEIEKELEEIDLNLSTIKKLKQQKKKLPEEKMKQAVELSKKKAEIQKNQKKSNKELEEINTYMENLKVQGRISASTRAFAGIKVMIKDAELEVRQDHKAVTFILDNGMVKVTRYQEPEEAEVERA
ncbi:MAG: FapA family protein [Spirochaetales bacterium]|nr:FapA family protein [Spirochaetales bacterium]MCF7937592.1 FapA family protein [Spirochaetales bacterium]